MRCRKRTCCHPAKHLILNIKLKRGFNWYTQPTYVHTYAIGKPPTKGSPWTGKQCPQRLDIKATQHILLCSCTYTHTERGVVHRRTQGNRSSIEIQKKDTTANLKYKEHCSITSKKGKVTHSRTCLVQRVPQRGCKISTSYQRYLLSVLVCVPYVRTSDRCNVCTALYWSMYHIPVWSVHTVFTLSNNLWGANEVSDNMDA
jgi:hypothetical protein